MPTSLTASQEFKKGIVILFLVLFVAGGFEWLLNGSQDNGAADAQFGSWRLPLIEQQEATANIIAALQLDGKWPGINDLPDNSGELAEASSGDESLVTRQLYTLAAIIQIEGQQEPVAILVNEQGLVERVKEGEEFGEGYRLEQVLNDQVDLRYSEPPNAELFKTLSLYPVVPLN